MFYRIAGGLKNFANLTGKYMCQLKCEFKSLTLSMQPEPKRDSSTQLFASEFCGMFKNNIFLEHSWVSASTYLCQTNR